MVFGFNGLTEFNDSLNSLADQANISVNSANERNDKLCKLLDLIQISLQDIKDEIHYIGHVEFLALQVVKGEHENESTSSKR